LSSRIQIHNESFVRLFNIPLMPKFHFLVHYCNFNKEEWDQKEMESKQQSERYASSKAR